MNELAERVNLVETRLEELMWNLKENANKDERVRYWSVCIEIALGKQQAVSISNEGCRYTDYEYCREVFGEELGKYSCMLYTQLQMLDQFRKEQQEELICICKELLVEVYLLEQEQEGFSAIRDALYWFYSDYCEIYAAYQMKLLKKGVPIYPGGPMLLSAVKGSCWEQHQKDYGLYMGNRFQERLFQAYASYRHEKEFAKLIESLEVLTEKAQIGFLTSSRQEEIFLHFLQRLKKCIV